MKRRKTVRTLWCDLTPEEFLQRSERLAATISAIKEKKSELQILAAPIKERIKELQATVAELAETVHARAEERDVVVWREIDTDAGVERTVREDTGEVVHSRALQQNEMQEEMPLDTSRDDDDSQAGAA